MGFIDRIKEDYQKVKDKPAKEKWGFFWDYYKIPAICIVLVVSLMVYSVLTITNQKEIVFSGVLLNCKIGIDEEDFLDGYYQHAGIDGETQAAAFYADMMLAKQLGSDKNNNTIQRIIAGVSVQDTDFITGDPYAFQSCAYNTSRLFKDLREFLDPETLEKYKDRLYYVDEDIIDQINNRETNLKTLEYPDDPKKPETMKKPIPVGIDISDCKAFMDTYYVGSYTDSDPVVYIGVVQNTLRPELAKQFISYLFAS